MPEFMSREEAISLKNKIEKMKILPKGFEVIISFECIDLFGKWHKKYYLEIEKWGSPDQDADKEED
jgi:uncharacterized membrane protein